MAAVQLLTPARKPDPYNPAALIDDWDQAAEPGPLTLATWLNRDARMSETPPRKLVAWQATMAIPGAGAVAIKPGQRVLRVADETVWRVVAVTPASTSPYTGWTPGTSIDLEMPVG